MENIYKKYRKKARMTQEQASYYLNCSLQTIKCYEADKRMPSSDIVTAMCVVYEDNRLAYEHLLKSSVAELILDQLAEKDLALAVLGFINQLENINDLKIKLLKIACDGEITDDEIAEWNNVQDQLRELITSAFEVIFKRG